MPDLDATSLLQTLGGLGLFLFGMVVMTDALRILAGASIRDALMRFTRSPLSGAITGAASTAILQSSSATTVAAVGFVGAGLMGFNSALGIVFGANVGTTLTGWIVMGLGFKLDLGALMLPIVLVGTLLRLFGRGRIASAGLAVAGFGVIFVGIEQMQLGMAGARGLLDLIDFPADTLLGRLELLLVGAAFTIVTQSSSAGVATVLTALHAGELALGQGLALVVGMDVGTTATAVFATIGGSAAAKRTGWSHLVYNLMTGLMAFAAITPYVMLWQWLAPERLASDAQIVLVAFHTGFNALGVALVLPVAGAFARLMLRIVPEPEGGYTTRLDRSLLAEPELALDAVTATLLVEFSALTSHTRWLLDPILHPRHVDLPTLQSALDETRDYTDRIVVRPTGDGSRPLVDCFHVLDHLQRLRERCEEDAVRARNARLAPSLAAEHRRLLAALVAVEASLAEERWADAEREALESSRALDASVQPLRQSIMERVASDRVTVAQAARELEALRWMSRVGYHVAKITTHLRRLRDPASTKEGSAA